MLTGEKLAMKREVFAKNAHFIGGVIAVNKEGKKMEFRV